MICRLLGFCRLEKGKGERKSWLRF
jgi:hypothetical protein